MPHKLLIADDSITIQRVIELTFADQDIDVIAVGNGRAAIERAELERPDIVLADAAMPERDGYEVAAFIKSHPELSHAPVVLLAGAFEPIDEARARAAGCDGVLVKPFEPQMVISRVKELLAGNRPPNMWAAGPTAQGPLRPAVPPSPRESTAVPGGTAMVPARAEAAPQEPSGSTRTEDPLEAYFDRLDAAVTAHAAAPRRPEPPVELFRSEPLGANAPPAPPQPGTTTAGSSAPSLADAFAALLTAEGRVPYARPDSPESNAAPPDPEALIEAIAQRVLARLEDSKLRAVVLDAAERLVREEIERLKRD
ncbi:MAG TPA: response regulator [Vicinamibacterales bacterium]|nr:response regulator [Vicinamibacterales bacterium]